LVAQAVISKTLRNEFKTKGYNPFGTTPMKLTILILIALFTAAALSQTQPSAKSAAPSTRRDDVQDVLYGVTVADPYRWLEDQNSSETRAWITQQNGYTHSMLDQLPGHDALRNRLTELKKVDGIHSPFERDGRFIYRHRRADQEQYAICLRQGEAGKEEVLIDPNPMSAEHTTNVDIADVSQDGKLLAYMLRAGGKDETEIHLLDLDTRHELPDVLPLALYFDVGFLPNNSGFYYSMMTDDGPRVRFHKMGSAVAGDTDVFGKGSGKEGIVVGDPTPDGRHLVMTACNGSACDKAEIWLQDLSTHGAIEPLVKDLDARFFPYPGGDHLFLHTNWKAPHGRVLAVDYAHPERDNWQEVVPESDTAIDGVFLSGGKIVVAYVKNAASEVKVFNPDGKVVRRLEFPALGSVSDIQTRWENKDAFIGFNSFTIPRTIYHFDMESGKRTTWYTTRFQSIATSLSSSRYGSILKTARACPCF
jgi:prolyl oligopeptidase